jgi:hypothetical protein
VAGNEQRDLQELRRKGMSRETMVQLLGVIVFAATVLVTVVAVIHLLSA